MHSWKWSDHKRRKHLFFRSFFPFFRTASFLESLNSSTSLVTYSYSQNHSRVPELIFHYSKRYSNTKVRLINFDMMDNFSFGVSSNLSQQKSPTAEIIGIYFLGTIVPRKYMPIISDNFHCWALLLRYHGSDILTSDEFFEPL